MELELAINQFVAAVNQKMEEYWAKNFPSLPVRGLAVQYKRNWAHLVITEGGTGRSSYGWIALKDFATKELGQVKAGDIHKSASYKKPAKHARGSVLQPESWTCAGPYDIGY